MGQATHAQGGKLAHECHWPGHPCLGWQACPIVFSSIWVTYPALTAVCHVAGQIAGCLLAGGIGDVLQPAPWHGANLG